MREERNELEMTGRGGRRKEKDVKREGKRKGRETKEGKRGNRE